MAHALVDRMEYEEDMPLAMSLMRSWRWSWEMKETRLVSCGLEFLAGWAWWWFWGVDSSRMLIGMVYVKIGYAGRGRLYSRFWAGLWRDVNTVVWNPYPHTGALYITRVNFDPSMQIFNVEFN